MRAHRSVGPMIRTVLGDVEPAAWRPTDYHEHLFQASPLLSGEDLDDEASSREEARLLHDSGLTAMIDATPIGLGRNPAAVARISAATGMHVVASTGAHREDHYPAGHWLRDLSVDELADRFAADITDGMPRVDTEGSWVPAHGPDGAPVRAGLVKTGVGYWAISAFEGRVLAAAAEAHRRTGVAVMVHLEHGSAGHEVLDRLAGEGLAHDRVVLAHVDRNPDPGLHLELAGRGAYLGYDGFARSRLWPDSVLLDCLREVVEGGAADRLLVGGDVARRSRYVAYGGMPGLQYLGERVVPRLRDMVGSDVVTAILVANPARLLGGHDTVAVA